MSRRQFTREFKLAAVPRLEARVSVTEAARGLEFNPNVLHHWRCELPPDPRTQRLDSSRVTLRSQLLLRKMTLSA